MNLLDLQRALKTHPNTYPRFVLPAGDFIPAHAHVTEVGHVVRKFIDCGGSTGNEEKVVLQTHVGSDIEHRLTSERLAKILGLGNRVLPTTDLEVDVEYDCCVVSQYPIVETRLEGKHLDLILQRGRTQCRANERRAAGKTQACCGTSSSSCD